MGLCEENGDLGDGGSGDFGARSGLSSDPEPRVATGDIGERRRGDSGGSDAIPPLARLVRPVDGGVVASGALASSSGDDRGDGSGGLDLRALGWMESSSSPSLSTTFMRRAGVLSSAALSSMSSSMLSSRSKLASA